MRKREREEPATSNPGNGLKQGLEVARGLLMLLQIGVGRAGQVLGDESVDNLATRVHNGALEAGGGQLAVEQVAQKGHEIPRNGSVGFEGLDCTRVKAHGILQKQMRLDQKKTKTRKASSLRWAQCPAEWWWWR